MWDEKQFFEDFAKESDKIKPSKEFVADLKNLDSENKIIELKRRKSIKRVLRYASVAAAIVVLITVGICIYAINRTDDSKSGEGAKVTLPIHAGQDETTADNNDFEAGLSSVLEFIGDEDVQIVDGNGNTISSEIRSDLKNMLEKAVVTDSITGLFGENTKYIIKAKEDITIRIYFEEYILINGSDMYCIE